MHGLDATEVRRHAGFEPARAQGIGAVVAAVGMQHGAVAGEQQFHRLRKPTAHLDAFADHAHGLPLALVTHFARVVQVGFVDVQVFLVDGEDGQPESDAAVVPDGNARQCRFARTDDVQAWRIQMHDAAQRGRRMQPVRVAGQDRPASGRAPRRHHPGVAAFHGRRRVDRRHRERRAPPGALHAARPHHDALCAQRERAQHLGRNARVQAVGHARVPGGCQRHAPAVGLRFAAAGHPRALHFRQQVAREAMAANAHHVVGLPLLGLVVEVAELHRQARRAAGHQVDVGIDASHKARGDALCMRAVGLPFTLHVAAVQEQARRAVLFDEVLAEHRRQPAQPAPPPQIHLEQPVACGVEALREEHVVFAAGVDVRHAPGVDQNLHRRSQARHAQGFAGGRAAGGLREGNWQGASQPAQHHHASDQIARVPEAGCPHRRFQKGRINGSMALAATTLGSKPCCTWPPDAAMIL